MEQKIQEETQKFVGVNVCSNCGDELDGCDYCCVFYCIQCYGLHTCE